MSIRYQSSEPESCSFQDKPYGMESIIGRQYFDMSDSFPGDLHWVELEALPAWRTIAVSVWMNNSCVIISLSSLACCLNFKIYGTDTHPASGKWVNAKSLSSFVCHSWFCFSCLGKTMLMMLKQVIRTEC